MLLQQFYQSPTPFCPPAAIPGNPPVNAGGVDAPDVTGTPAEGQTLNCAPGEWSGDEPITYSYQWYQEGAVAPPGEVLTDELGEPLTDELGEELTT